MEIEAPTPLEAWRAACRHLISVGGEDHSLRVRFVGAAADERAIVDYSPQKKLGGKFDSARDVANTIFPQKSWEKVLDRQSLYLRYLKGHRKRKRKSWGSYFERMIAFGKAEVNQLERVVTALSNWTNCPKAALVMHLSSAETDGLRPIGAPCLQYVQFGCAGSKLNLIAVYRNHDFCNKALGNYVGLSRLLTFVATETSKTVGSVTVISLHAYFDVSQAKLKQLASLN